MQVPRICSGFSGTPSGGNWGTCGVFFGRTVTGVTVSWPELWIARVGEIDDLGCARAREGSWKKRGAGDVDMQMHQDQDVVTAFVSGLFITCGGA